jgi:bla regulator protein blaR1
MSFLNSFWASEFIRAFGWTLLHSLWQGLAIFILAALSMVFLRNSTPRARYNVLYGFLALIPVAFIITFFIIYQPEQSITGTPSLTAIARWDSIPITGTPSLNTGTPSLYSSLLAFLDHNTPWLFVLWFGGFMILLIRFSGSLLYLNRLRRRGLVDVSQDWKCLADRLAKQIGLKKPVRLAESSRVRVPVTIGYLKPLILMPAGLLSGVPAQQIDAILLHELAHIYRRDYLLNLIQSVVEMLFFYHPVTWYLSNQIREEREQICDDMALSIHHDRINYIKALTTMEEMNNVKSPVLANALTGQRKRLLYRVKRLIGTEKINRGFAEGIIGFLLLAMVVLAISTNAITYAASGEENPEVCLSSVVPTAYDLSGRESGEKVTNFLPVSFVNQVHRTAEDQTDITNAKEPDTIITKSENGKVTVKVISDTTVNKDGKEMRVIVETSDEGGPGKEHVYKEEKVIRINANANCPDHNANVIIIKDGDTVKSCEKQYRIVCPGSGDSFNIETLPPIPGMPEMPDFHEYYFNFGSPEEGDSAGMAFFNFKMDSLIDTAVFFKDGQPYAFYLNGENMEEAMRQYEDQWRMMEDQQLGFEDQQRAMEEQRRAMHEQQREMEWMNRDGQVYVYSPDSEGFGWSSAPEPYGNSTEKVIRQELREDGLVSPGKTYIIEISPKDMYINGEKQGKELSKKYRHLVEGLEPELLDDNGTFKVVF